MFTCSQVQYFRWSLAFDDNPEDQENDPYIAGPLVAFDSPWSFFPSLLRIFSGAWVLSRCWVERFHFDHFATSWRLLYFEYPEETRKVEYHQLLGTGQPELDPDVEGGPCWGLGRWECLKSKLLVSNGMVSKNKYSCDREGTKPFEVLTLGVRTSIHKALFYIMIL